MHPGWFKRCLNPGRPFYSSSIYVVWNENISDAQDEIFVRLAKDGRYVGTSVGRHGTFGVHFSTPARRRGLLYNANRLAAVSRARKLQIALVSFRCPDTMLPADAGVQQSGQHEARE